MIANNPIDTDGFSHFLNFVSLGFPDLYQITEPKGFDVANFVVQQNDERFGRDIYYGNQTSNEAFYDIFGIEKLSKSRIINPQGQQSEYLDMGLFWILETYKRFGFEGKIERILKKDGLQFTIGLLDLANPDTDGYTYFGCNIIQNTQIANYKKQLDTSIDLFSTKNIREESILPATTFRFLRKAVPIFQQSQINSIINFVDQNLSSTPSVGPESKYYYYNNCNSIVLNEIPNTTSFTDVIQSDNDGNDITANSFKIITAVKSLINVEVLFENFTIIQRIDTDNGGHGYADNKLVVKWGFDINSATEINPLSFVLNDGDTEVTYSLDSSNNNIKIPLLPAGANVWVFMKTEARESATSINPRLEAFTTLSRFNIKISASSVSLDTVINGVRYIDVLKQCSNFINKLPIDGKIFDKDGKYYNNVCWNRALLSMQTSNSKALISNTDPEGNYIGEVITNTNSNIMNVGMYFWNGSVWIYLDKNNIQDIILVDAFTPAGTFEGELANNITDTDPKGLVYWNLINWVSIEKSSPFMTSIKDAFEASMTIEVCGDYEIQEDKIFLGQYADFYTNIELAKFLINPDKDIKEYWNERFKINNVSLGYETFETNRLSKNTANDIHTKAEWSIPNVYVENKLERSSKYIRSAFSSQAMVNLETNTPATADDNDDKVFINTIIELESGDVDSICTFQTLISNTITADGKLHLSNTNSTGSSNEVFINWNTRGLTVGQTVTLSNCHNAGDYTIEKYTNSDLVLIPITTTPIFNGDDVVTINYQYLDVFWKTKTNEYIDTFGTLENPDKFPNLDFTLRRNLANWENYLATACFFRPEGTVKNLYYRNNPPLKSQAFGHPVYTEKGNISVSDLPIPILTTKIYDLVVYAGFSEILDLLNRLKTDRGYVTCYDQNSRLIKGYIQKLDYLWKSGSLKLTLEERYEKDFIILTFSSSILSVTDKDYAVSGTVSSWKIVGDYFQCFDEFKQPIILQRHYSEVKLNGVIYESAELLYDALLIL